LKIQLFVSHFFFALLKALPITEEQNISDSDSTLHNSIVNCSCLASVYLAFGLFRVAPSDDSLNDHYCSHVLNNQHVLLHYSRPAFAFGKTTMWAGALTLMKSSSRMQPQSINSDVRSREEIKYLTFKTAEKRFALARRAARCASVYRRKYICLDKKSCKVRRF
jgi:hypothetical protein